MALASEFKVSQAPVREALRELEALALLESERYCSTRVRGIDLQELREAYELRAEIEDASARRAVPVAAAHLDELDAAIKNMRKLHREQNIEAYTDSVLRAWENMAWDVRARIAVQRIGLIPVFEKNRQEVVAALREGDGKRAGNLLRGIMEGALGHLAKHQKAAALSQ